MRSLFFFAAVTTVTLLLSSRADAGAANPGFVSADAEWMLHIDVEAMVGSQLGTYVLEHAEELGIDMLHLEQLEEELGIDPFEDLLGVTVYGIGNPDEHSVAVVTVTETIDEVIEMASQDPDHYRQVRHGDRVIHVWEENDETIYLHVRPGVADTERVLVVSDGEEKVQWGIDVMDGRVPNLRTGDSPRMNIAPRRGSFIFAAADTLEWLEMDDDAPAGVIAERASDIAIDFGESGDMLFVDLFLATANEADAQNVADVLQGVMALGSLIGRNDPGLAPIAMALEGVTIQSEGNALGIEILQPVVVVIEQLQEHAD